MVHFKNLWLIGLGQIHKQARGAEPGAINLLKHLAVFKTIAWPTTATALALGSESIFPTNASKTTALHVILDIIDSDLFRAKPSCIEPICGVPSLDQP